MAKMIVINNCDECPNKIWSQAEMVKHLGYETAFFCGKACMPLEKTNDIPPGCPLSDYQERQE